MQNGELRTDALTAQHSIYVATLSPTESRVFIQTHGSQIRCQSCDTENRLARTKTALKLLGLAPWKNTPLLGASNVIRFLLAPSHAVQSGWVNGAGDYHQQMSIMSMTIWDSLALFAVFGLNEKSN